MAVDADGDGRRRVAAAPLHNAWVDPALQGQSRPGLMAIERASSVTYRTDGLRGPAPGSAGGGEGAKVPRTSPPRMLARAMRTERQGRSVGVEAEFV